MSSFLFKDLNAPNWTGLTLSLAPENEEYQNLRTYSSVNPLIDNINIQASEKYLSYIDSTAGGSCLAVIPLTSFGKNHIPINSPAYQQPLLRAHSQAIQSFAFSPFYSDKVFTCSLDNTLKLWTIPNGGLLVDNSTPTSTYTGLKSIKGFAPHGSLENVLALRAPREIKIIDFENQKDLFSASNFLADILSMSWSNTASTLITSQKNCMLSLFDLRASQTASASVKSHEGTHYSSSHWLGDSDYFISTGHNKVNREVYLWDSRKLEQPIIRHNFDGSVGSPLVCTVDNDTGLIVCGGKGDSIIKVFQANSTELQEITSFDSSKGIAGKDLTRAFTILPKKSSTLSGKKIFKLLKLTDSEVHTINFNAEKVENYSEIVSSLYTTSGTLDLPSSLSTEEWVNGSNALPKGKVLEVKVSLSPISTTDSAASSGPTSPTPSNASTTPVSTSPVPSTSSRISSGLGSVFKLKHIYGKENPKDTTYFDLQPDLSALDSPILAADDQYFAIPHRGGGGQIYVGRHGFYGKVPPNASTLCGHKSSVQELAFSPFHSGLLLSGSTDSNICLWNVEEFFDSVDSSPTSPIVPGKKNYYPIDKEIQPFVQFKQHSNSIRTINFHPIIANMFCSTSQDMTLKFFDINNESLISSFKLDQLPNNNSSNLLVSNTSFNYDGSLLAMTTKERYLHIIDPRIISNSTATLAHSVSSQDCPELGRNLRVEWCASNYTPYDPLVTVSSNNTGGRSISLWDPRNMKNVLVTKYIDNGSGLLFPFYDPSLNSVFVAGKGDTMIRTFEMYDLNQGSSSAETSNYLFDKVNEFQTSKDPIAGICMLSKRSCNFRQIEVSKILKLTSDSIIPISFTVPRAEHLKQYFQSDLYPPIISKNSSVSPNDWVEACKVGEQKQDFSELTALLKPELESLKPYDMIDVNDRPAEHVTAPSQSNSKISMFRSQIESQKEEEKQRENTFNKLQQLAFQNAQYNKNLSGPIKIGGLVTNLNHLQEDSDSENDWD